MSLAYAERFFFASRQRLFGFALTKRNYLQLTLNFSYYFLCFVANRSYIFTSFMLVCSFCRVWSRKELPFTYLIYRHVSAGSCHILSLFLQGELL